MMVQTAKVINEKLATVLAIRSRGDNLRGLHVLDVRPLHLNTEFSTESQLIVYHLKNPLRLIDPITRQIDNTKMNVTIVFRLFMITPISIVLLLG